MNTYLLQTWGITLLPLLLGLLLVLCLRVNLKSFQAIYLLLGASLLGICWYAIPTEISLREPLLCLFIGEVLHFLAIGAMGSKMKIANYASLLYLVGLFPWYWSFSMSTTYLAFFFTFATMYSYFRLHRAARKSQVKLGRRMEDAKRLLSPEEYVEFSRRASVILAAPALAAALLLIPFFLVR